jgi:hypothetical protein
MRTRALRAHAHVSSAIVSVTVISTLTSQPAAWSEGTCLWPIPTSGSSGLPSATVSPITAFPHRFPLPPSPRVRIRVLCSRVSRFTRPGEHPGRRSERCSRWPAACSPPSSSSTRSTRCCPRARRRVGSFAEWQNSSGVAGWLAPAATAAASGAWPRAGASGRAARAPCCRGSTAPEDRDAGPWGGPTGDTPAREGTYERVTEAREPVEESHPIDTYQFGKETGRGKGGLAKL